MNSHPSKDRVKCFKIVGTKFLLTTMQILRCFLLDHFINYQITLWNCALWHKLLITIVHVPIHHLLWL